MDIGFSAGSTASRHQQIAQRILNSATGALPVAMTTPPTITLSATNAATTISGGVYVYPQDSSFTFLGSRAASDAPVGALVSGGSWNGNSGPINRIAPETIDRNTYRLGNVLRVRFGYPGRYLDLDVSGGGTLAHTRIWVNGQPTAVAPRLDLTTYALQQYVIDFGSYASRVVEIEINQGVTFGGVTREPNYSIYSVPVTTPRLGIIGDSYQEAGANGANALQSSGMQAAKILGLADAWNLGESATGFITGGAQSGKTYMQKLAGDVLPYNFDWHVLIGGINDAGQNAAAVQAAVTAYEAALLGGNPNAGLTVIGPLRAPGLNPSTAINAAHKAAAMAQPEYGGRLMFFDTFAENWVQIAGNASTPSGSGNSNWIIGADNIHPNGASGATQANDYLGTMIANAVLRHCRALVS